MRSRGFTMVELMVVVGIMGILMAIAAPAFSSFIANQRVRDTASDLVTVFLRARSEALTRNVSVSVVPVSGTSDWATGWNVPNPAYAGKYIDQHGPATGVTVTGSGLAAGTVAYTNVGRIGSSAQLDISATGATMARCVTVEIVGRPKVKSCACASTC